MIHFTHGNLLDARAEALVNTVNEVGVMGKGIALMFKEAFPGPSKAYVEASKQKRVRVGHVLLSANDALSGPRWIIHFPTKTHWRYPSKMEWIRSGLQDLVGEVREHGIRSIALPPLGCGSGGLEWAQVRREIEVAFDGLPDVDVTVYEPSSAYLNAPKRAGVEELTPARALIAELVRRYSTVGLDCTNLEVQKLAWFLQRSILDLGIANPLRLNFKANKYGPYADNLRHLLNELDGSYLHCEKRLADAGPYDAIWFDPERRDTVTRYLDSSDARPVAPALERTTALIAGFESPLGMELLATVDWLLHEKHSDASLEGVKKGLGTWPGAAAAGRRKLKLFDDRLLTLALERFASSS